MERSLFFSGGPPQRRGMQADARYKQDSIRDVAASRRSDDVDRRPARPRKSVAMSSPYQTPISADVFYSSPAPVRAHAHSPHAIGPASPSRSRGPSGSTQMLTPRNNTRSSPTEREGLLSSIPDGDANEHDDSRDEIDFLGPQRRDACPTRERTSLHGRMRRRDSPPTSRVEMSAQPGDAEPVEVPLRAMNISKYFMVTHKRMSLVSFKTHFALFSGTSQFASISLRDVLNWKVRIAMLPQLTCRSAAVTLARSY